MIIRPLRRKVTILLRFLTISVVLLTFAPTIGVAQSEFTGLFRNYNGIRIADGNDFIVGRNLLRTNFRHDVSQARFYFSGEVLNSYTQRSDSLQFRFREAYIDYYFETSELRIGKQIISRGRANGAILSDILSPFDLSEFLTQDFSDLRQGTYSINYMVDVGPHQIDLVLNPVVSENLLPSEGSTWDFRPMSDLPIGIRYLGYNRRYSLSNMQFSTQFRYRPTKWLNLDLSAQYWEYPLPTYGKTIRFDGLTPYLELQEMRLRSPMYGLSGDVNIKSGLLATFEGTYYTKRLLDKILPTVPNLPGGNTGEPLNPILIELFQGRFNDPDNYTVEKSFAQLMGGLDLSYGSTFASVQGIVEYIPDHDQEVAQRKINTTASFLFRNSWIDDRLRVQTFLRYGLVGQDYWINPELSWKPFDEATLTVGAQIFGGPESTDLYNFRLSRYTENNFVFAKLTWNW